MADDARDATRKALTDHAVDKAARLAVPTSSLEETERLNATIRNVAAALPNKDVAAELIAEWGRVKRLLRRRVGEHVPSAIAMEAAKRLADCERERDELWRKLHELGRTIGEREQERDEARRMLRAAAEALYVARGAIDRDTERTAWDIVDRAHGLAAAKEKNR